MALKIRLARGGAKKRPFYRMVVAENTAPRDGKFIERIGSFNPLLEKDHADRLVVRTDRAKYWLSIGATATERVQKLFAEAGVIEKFTPQERPKKSAPRKKAQEKMKAAMAAANSGS